MSATWATYGSLEPDSAYDRQGYAWADGPDPKGCAEQGACSTSRVYFNAFATYGGLGAIKGQFSLNPNSAILGSRVEPTAGASFIAMLGQWTDCNHDGYIGLADGSLREYRDIVSEAAGFPVDREICPSLDDSNPVNWGRVHYNAQGGWVTEMIYIGDIPSTQGSPSREIVDPHAVVWGDAGAPEPGPGVGDCYSVTWMQTGEASHTGGFVHHAECVDGNAAGGSYQTLMQADATGTLASADPRPLWAEGGALDAPTFGPETACPEGRQPCEDNHAIVWGEADCGAAAPLVDISDPAPGVYPSRFPTLPVQPPITPPWLPLFPITPLAGYGPRPAGVPHVNPSGNVPATYNETMEESALDDCNGADDSGHDFYGNVETGPPTPSLRSTPDYAFMFFPFGSGSLGLTNSLTAILVEGLCQGGPITVGNPPITVGEQPPVCLPFLGAPSGRVPCDAANATSCGMPEDFGMPWFMQAAAGAASSTGELWQSAKGDPFARAPAPAVRGTPTGPSFDLAPADSATLYAHVEAPGLAYPSGASGAVYGAAFCTGGIARGAPVTNHWDCDPDHWPTRFDGIGAVRSFGVVGMSYQLRDTDCFDGTLVGKGSSLNPTGGDVGPHALDAGSACP